MKPEEVRLRENLREIPGMMDKMIKMINRCIDQLVEKAPSSGYKIGCHDCTEGYCCMQSTVIFPGEAIWMASKHPVPADLWDEYIRADNEMAKGSRADHFERAIRCVYQTDDKQCSIYDVRPMCCRRYIVACPSEMCSPEYKDKVPALNLNEIDMVYTKTMIGINMLLDISLPAVGTLPFMMVMATQLLASNDPVRFINGIEWLDIEGTFARG